MLLNLTPCIKELSVGRRTNIMELPRAGAKSLIEK